MQKVKDPGKEGQVLKLSAQALEGSKVLLTGECKRRAYRVCNAMKSKHGWGKKKTERCVLKVKKKGGC